MSLVLRNASVFRLGGEKLPRGHGLADALQQKALRPVRPLEAASSGWIAPFGEALVHEAMGASWVRLGRQERVLPAAVIRQEADLRAEQIADRSGRPVRGKARRRLREEVTTELLPKAFVRMRHTDAIIDASTGLLWIDAVSDKARNDFVEFVLDSVAGLEVQIPANDERIRSRMTRWLHDGPPEEFELGQRCALQDQRLAASIARLTFCDLRGKEVAAHLAHGRLATELELRFGDQVDLLLTDSFVLKRLRALDTFDSDSEDDSPEAALDASFVLTVGLLRELTERLEAVIG